MPKGPQGLTLFRKFVKLEAYGAYAVGTLVIVMGLYFLIRNG